MGFFCFVFIIFGGHMSFLWGLFWTSGDICPGFQSQVGLACMLSCLHAIPQIHLWCDTCRPLDRQHGSRATLTHILAAVRHIHKHWWHLGGSRGLNLWPGPGLEPTTSEPQHSALNHSKLYHFGRNYCLFSCHRIIICLTELILITSFPSVKPWET